MEHAKLKVTLKDSDSGEEFFVNSTPPKVLEELKKPVHERSHFIMADAHEPYFDPNIHELVEPKAKGRVKLDPKAAAAAKAAADAKTAADAQAKKNAATAGDDDDEDDDD